jgi:hypothetical protein
VNQQQSATDFVASLIRTYVPGLAGLILGWVATLHLPFHVEGLNQGVVEAAISAAIAGVWYLLVRTLETRWPKLGVFLGVPKPPVYTPPTVTTSVAGDGKLQFEVAAPVFTAAQLTGPEVQPVPDADTEAPGVTEPAAPAQS